MELILHDAFWVNKPTIKGSFPKLRNTQESKEISIKQENHKKTQFYLQQTLS